MASGTQKKNAQKKAEKDRDEAQKAYNQVKKEFAPAVAQWSFNQATAVRDILMMYPKVANMPEVRDWKWSDQQYAGSAI